MTIESLYFEGCPNHERLRERLPALLKGRPHRHPNRRYARSPPSKTPHGSGFSAHPPCASTATTSNRQPTTGPTAHAENLVGHHLRALREAGLARPRREGKIVFYSLTGVGRGLIDGHLHAVGEPA